MEQNILLVCTLSIVLGVILMIAFLLRKQHDTAMKEVAKLEQRLTEIEEKLDMSVQTGEQSAPQAQGNGQQTGAPTHIIKKRPADLSSMTDKEIFRYISKVIVEEELFRWPDFNRTAVMEQFSLSAARVGAVFSRGGGQSLPEFVRNCRLDYASRLMLERPHLSFTEIGESSGFQHTTTFYHDFKARFGMAPAEYRKLKVRG